MMLKLPNKSKDIHNIVKTNLTTFLGAKTSKKDTIEWTKIIKTRLHSHLLTRTHAIKDSIKTCMNQIQTTHFD
jgi:hypothetical protein